MRQVSLWSQPKAFAVKGVGGVFWCEALLEGSQAPRMLCLDYFFPCFLGFVLSPGSGLFSGFDPQHCSTIILWRASYGWNFYSISFSCSCQPNVAGGAGNREAAGEWNVIPCVIYQIPKCFRSCCMASHLILNIEVYTLKCCVTFLTGQGSLHPFFRAVVFRWLLSIGLMRFLPRPWVVGRTADGSIVGRSCAFWVLLRCYIAELQGNFGESVKNNVFLIKNKIILWFSTLSRKYILTNKTENKALHNLGLVLGLLVGFFLLLWVCVFLVCFFFLGWFFFLVFCFLLFCFSFD